MDGKVAKDLLNTREWLNLVTSRDLAGWRAALEALFTHALVSEQSDRA